MPAQRRDPIAVLRALGVDSDTLALDSGGTIVGSRRLNHAEVVDDLASWPLPIGELGELLGRGGMGEVRAASQHGLDREVAVKTVLADADTPKLRQALFCEAWVTGQLEHPHVVPVYAIGGGEDGRQAIVMKRIQGLPWSELLEAGPEHPLFDGAEPLEVHLQILEQVCQVVHFAHSRRILHRDIKPDNVMLGVHGEVYLVDWGLAVTLAGAARGPLVSASEVDGIQGTPGYLAPEMVRVDERQLSEGTDVFLLGATLHRVLTGEERWPGQGVIQKVVHALECVAHPYGSEVPAELAAIAARATRERAEDRFASADELRRALASYRAHAAALRVTARALASLDELGRALDDSEPDRVRIAALAAESRFGLQLAMEQWPEGPKARDGLAALSARMVERELANDNVDGAEEWLGLAPQPDVATAERIEALRRDLAARREADARRLERERDTRVGARHRFVFAALGASLIAVIGVGALIWDRVTGEAPGHEPLIVLLGVCALTSLRSIVRSWPRIPQAARVQAVLTFYGWASLLLLVLVGALLGFELWQTTVLVFTNAALTWAVLAGLASWRMWIACGVFTLAAVLTVLAPGHVWLLIAVSGALGMSAVAWAWWADSKERSLKARRGGRG